MYITINGQRYSCTRREADADEVRYYGVEPLPESVSGIVRTCTEAGFVLAEDHAEAYARQEIGTTRVTLTNKPEPQPEPEPEPEPVVYDVQMSTVNAVKMLMLGAKPVTADEKISVSALWPEWQEGSHTLGEVYTVDGDPWECIQAYDNATYPDIRPDNAAWVTFNKPLHGTTRQTARKFVQPTGAHDMYKAGEWAVLGGEFYRCKQDTAYSPTDYAQAWEVIDAQAWEVIDE